MKKDFEFDLSKYRIFFGYNKEGGYWFYYKRIDNAIFTSLCKFYFEISWDDYDD